MTNQAEWNAKDYHRVSNPHVNWGRIVLDRLEVRGDEVVLDAGCGTGRLTGELLERLPNGRVIALDHSPAMLETARLELAPKFGDQVSFFQADLQRLTPEDVGEPVDAIFSTATFHWVLDHDRLFPGLFSVLKPGGWLVAQCGGGPNLNGFYALVNWTIANEPYAQYFVDWKEKRVYNDVDATVARLEASGFTNIDTFLNPEPTPMETERDYIDFISTVIMRNHLAAIPDPDLRAALLRDIAHAAAQETPPLTLDYWRLNIKAQRPD